VSPEHQQHMHANGEEVLLNANTLRCGQLYASSMFHWQTQL